MGLKIMGIWCVGKVKWTHFWGVWKFLFWCLGIIFHKYGKMFLVEWMFETWLNEFMDKKFFFFFGELLIGALFDEFMDMENFDLLSRVSLNFNLWKYFFDTMAFCHG